MINDAAKSERANFGEQKTMPPRPALSQINLVCRNPAASLAFYRRLGVDFPEPRLWASADRLHHAAASGEAGLDFELDSESFARRWNRGWQDDPAAGGRVVITFSVQTREGVDEIHEALVADGAQSRQPPYDAFWGARYAIVVDPDGVAVGLMSPIDDAKTSPPPEL